MEPTEENIERFLKGQKIVENLAAIEMKTAKRLEIFILMAEDAANNYEYKLSKMGHEALISRLYRIELECAIKEKEREIADQIEEDAKDFFGLDKGDKLLGFMFVGVPSIDWPKGPDREWKKHVNWISE